MQLLKYFWLGYLIPWIEKSEEMLDEDNNPSIYSWKRPYQNKGTYRRLTWLGLQIGSATGIEPITEYDRQMVPVEGKCTECGYEIMKGNRLGELSCDWCGAASSVFDTTEE